MNKLEDWHFCYGVSGKPLQVVGFIYGDDRFADGSRINTSRLMNIFEDRVETKNSTYYLGRKSYIQEVYNFVQDNNYKLLRKGADAIHKLGNIKRDTYDVELIYAQEETEDEYIGSFIEGFGFINVRFKKSDCRNPTQEELEMIDEGNLELIKF